MNFNFHVSYTKKDEMVDCKSPVLMFLEIYILYTDQYNHIYYIYIFKKKSWKQFKTAQNILGKCDRGNRNLVICDVFYNYVKECMQHLGI